MGILAKYSMAIFGLCAVAVLALALAAIPPLRSANEAANAVSLRAMQQALFAQHVRHGEDLAQALAEALGTPLMLRDVEGCQEVVNAFQNSKGLLAVTVQDDRGQLVCERASPKAPPVAPAASPPAATAVHPGADMRPHHDDLTFRKPVLLHGRHALGELTLVMSTRIIAQEETALAGNLDAIQRDMTSRARQAVLVAGGGVLLLAAGLALWLGRTISHPIRRMARQLDEAGHRQDVHLPTRRDDELGALARSIEAMRARDQELEELKNSFVSSVSHELRTPLTSILGFGRLIRKDLENHILPSIETSDPRRRAQRAVDNMGIIEQESCRLMALVNDLLDLNRIEAGRMQWRFAPQPPADLLRDAVARVQGARDDADAVALRVETAPDLPPVVLDRDRMLQVCINLLSNALKFTSRGEVVARAVHAGPHHVEFQFQDTGPGVPEALRGSLFQRFARGEDVGPSLPGRPQGAGLGLALCREIVGSHEGEIWHEDPPSGGSLFRVRLRAEGPTRAESESAR